MRKPNTKGSFAKDSYNILKFFEVTLQGDTLSKNTFAIGPIWEIQICHLYLILIKVESWIWNLNAKKPVKGYGLIQFYMERGRF